VTFRRLVAEEPRGDKRPGEAATTVVEKGSDLGGNRNSQRVKKRQRGKADRCKNRSSRLKGKPGWGVCGGGVWVVWVGGGCFWVGGGGRPDAISGKGSEMERS